MQKPIKTTIAVALPLLVAATALAIFTKRSSAPDFSEFAAGPERKEAFFNYFLPIVEARNQEILALREELIALLDKDKLSRRDNRRLAEIARQYRMEDFNPSAAESREILLRRVDVVPPSLALAQAAKESGWGTSRFAQEGNNFFGQWCFEPGCGMVPRNRDGGKRHEVADFASPEDSVIAYIANLNRGDAYAPLREIRAELREEDRDLSGLELAEGLEKYSERGEVYIDEVKSMIRFNKLTAYDAALAAAEAEEPAEPAAPGG